MGYFISVSFIVPFYLHVHKTLFLIIIFIDFSTPQKEFIICPGHPHWNVITLDCNSNFVLFNVVSFYPTYNYILESKCQVKLFFKLLYILILRTFFVLKDRRPHGDWWVQHQTKILKLQFWKKKSLRCLFTQNWVQTLAQCSITCLLIGFGNFLTSSEF